MFAALPLAHLLGAIAFTQDLQLVYAFPLLVAISLVYGATRHEKLVPIINNAIRSAIWIVVFMSVIFAVFWFLGEAI